MPSFLAFAVVGLLEKHFGRLVDYEFTAKMEDDLDGIARGEAERCPGCSRFYFGEADATGRDAARRPTSAASRNWSPTSARSTPARSTPSRSAKRHRRCASAGTGRTWNVDAEGDR